MSRISRYQNSISKYMKTKSCIINLDTTMKTQILDILEDSDYSLPIILLTILSNQNRKNKTSLHGYYMGCGIELMMIISKLIENKTYYITKYSDQEINRIIVKISTLINLCLSQNVECIQKSVSKEKTLKMFHDSIKLLTSKLFDVLITDNIELEDYIKKTDLFKYEFNINKPKDKILKLKQVKKQDLITFIKKKYGSVCQSALILGYQLGSGSEIVKQLEKMGEYLGIMVKISNDFKNLERDLNHSKDFTFNYVLNYGLQDSFELFMEAKTNIIETCITFDLYSHTMKEVLDLIESRIDLVLGKTKADLKSNYTITQSSSSK